MASNVFTRSHTLFTFGGRMKNKTLQRILSVLALNMVLTGFGVAAAFAADTTKITDGE
jgi:hypothetical protein